MYPLEGDVYVAMASTCVLHAQARATAPVKERDIDPYRTLRSGRRLRCLPTGPGAMDGQGAD